MPDCPVCELPIREEDDPHWDEEGRSQHPECCRECNWMEEDEDT
jgi:hypothetical protein